MQTYTQNIQIIGRVGVLLLAVWSAACNSGSVVNTTDNLSTASSPTPAATAAATTNTPATAATIAATPVTLATPMAGTTVTTASSTLASNGIAATGEGAPAGSAQGVRHIGDFPVELTTAKKGPTPEPDAFSPRPTPPVIMADGKIKQPWPAPAEALAMQNPLPRTPENIAQGREWFNQRCADCHGKAGKGNGWMGGNTKRDGRALPPTNLVSQVVQANSDGELFWKITNGRSPMPSSRVRFDDTQRWQMVLYLRTLK